jgi:lysozyme family protein
MPYLLLAGELDYPHSDVVMSSARREVPEAAQVWSKSAWCKIGMGQLDEALKFALHASSIHHGDAEARAALTKIQELRKPATTWSTTLP